MEEQQDSISHMVRAHLDPGERCRHIGATIGISVCTDRLAAKVLINDYHVKRVGGTPPYTFLLAIRHGFEDPNAAPDLRMMLLLRVVGRASVPHDDERERVLEQYHRAKPHAQGLWPQDQMINNGGGQKGPDVLTQGELQFGALDCDILGTIYPGQDGWTFGSDVEYSVNACMYDVLRPDGELLDGMLDIIREATAPAHKRREEFGLKPVDGEGGNGLMPLGKVKFSSTHFLQDDPVNDCPVYLDPMELIGNRTGVFGMSRSGKSNLIKIMMTNMHTAYRDEASRMGQLVFDVNGEYANTNKQDGGSVAQCLGSEAVCFKADTRGVGHQHEYLPNFYYDLNLGFRMIRLVLEEQNAGGASEAFKVLMTVSIPEADDEAGLANMTSTELLRRLAFRALLYKSGFPLIRPEKGNSDLAGNEDIHKWITSKRPDNNPRDATARRVINYFMGRYGGHTQLPHIIFADYIYDVFRRWRDDKTSSGLHVEDIDKGTEAIISMVSGFSESTKRNISGSGYFTMAHPQHSEHGFRPFQRVRESLKQGKLVIIDLSGSTPSARAGFMEEQASYIFNEYNNRFVRNEESRALLIYIEEAHNMLGNSARADDIWPRIAKEGAKMNIGLVFATQEPSSIQSNILKNTDNFIVLHMNNSSEAGFMGGYGFARFTEQIQRVGEIGYIRIKHKNIPFPYPCKVRKFEPSDSIFDAYRIVEDQPGGASQSLPEPAGSIRPTTQPTAQVAPLPTAPKSIPTMAPRQPGVEMSSPPAIAHPAALPDPRGTAVGPVQTHSTPTSTATPASSTPAGSKWSRQVRPGSGTDEKGR